MFAKRLLRINNHVLLQTTKNSPKISIRNFSFHVNNQIQKRTFFWSKSDTKMDPIDAAVQSTGQSNHVQPMDTKSVPVEMNSEEIVVENGIDLIDKSLQLGTSSESILPKLEAIQSLGDLHSLGLASYYSPIGWIQNAVELCYLTFGLSWWATLIVSTFVIRFALFPIAVKAQKASVDLQNLRPLIDPLKEKAAVLQQRGDTQGALRENQKVIQVFKDHNVSPFSAFWGFLQIPVFISFFFGIKRMAELPVPGFSTGGIGWITDLSLADPYYILPVAASLSMLLSFEANRVAMASMSPGAKSLFRAMSVLAIPVFINFASGLMIYTITNGIVTLLQVLLFQIPAVRKYFGLQLSNPDSLTPQKGLLKTTPLSLSAARNMIKGI